MATCTVCRKQERPTIDARLLNGATVTDISKAYNLKIDAVRRHLENHVDKSSDSSTTLAMIRQVVAELDDLASAAMAKGDHRAAIDARRQKAAALQSLLEQERTQDKATTKGTSDVNLAMLDAIVNRVMKHCDPCPCCGSYTVPKATGKMSGKVLN